MPDPISDSALLSMCMTWRHDFGLLDRKEQMAIKRELLGLYEYHVKPAIDRASSAESSLAAMRQRLEEAERQRDGYKKACNDVIGEVLAKDEQDRIGHHIAGLLSYTMIVQALPPGMVNAQALREAVEAWRESRKSVKADDISTVQSYRAERDSAIARAERAEGTLRDAVSKLNQVKEYLEDYFEGTRDHRYIGIQCIIEIGVKRITNTLADAILPSPPADASTMGGERERKITEALRHVCKHLCQWKDVCETGCLVSASLAEMEQKS